MRAKLFLVPAKQELVKTLVFIEPIDKKELVVKLLSWKNNVANVKIGSETWNLFTRKKVPFYQMVAYLIDEVDQDNKWRLIKEEYYTQLEKYLPRATPNRYGISQVDININLPWSNQGIINLKEDYVDEFYNQ